MTRPLSVRCSSLALLATLGAVTFGAPAAHADTFDLSLGRLVLTPAPGTAADPASADNVSAGALAAYRQVVSEMSVALAPKFLTPADTVGYSGFHFSLDYSLTSYTNRQCTGANPELNKATCPFQYGVEGGKNGPLPGLMHTVSIMARKGIWLPLPSFEIGAGATSLLQSSTFAVQAYAKFALHEGFHGWPIPSIALRGSGLRVMGSNSIDLTMVQVDGSVSKSFGIAGTVTLVPYVGAAWLYVIPRGQVIDLTPGTDSYRQGANASDLFNNTVFPSSANENIDRWRFFAGLRMNYSVLVLSVDYVATLCGDFNGRCDGSGHPSAKVPDNSDTQHTFSASVGLLF